MQLAGLFEWEDVLLADARSENNYEFGVDADVVSTSSLSTSCSVSSRAVPTRGCTEEFVIIDGANVAWSLAQKLKSRFSLNARVPMSSAVLAALDYEPWRERGILTHAFIPREYVVGYVSSVCDGGGMATVNADVVEYLGKGKWCNRRLMDEVDKGRLTLVSREGEDGMGSRKADDLTILSRAKEADAWVCSNDKFRDHRRQRGIGFSGGKALKEFARLRRLDHNFLISPGLDDDMLQAVLAASEWKPRIGASFYEAYDGPERRAVKRDASAPIPYYAMPHHILPVYFEPLPTDSMKTARKHYIERQEWSIARIDKHVDC